MAELQTTTIDGRDIAYRESAGSGPTIVFVHGNSSSSATFRPQLEGDLGARFRCLALDLPGHGDSAPYDDPAAFALPGYAATLAAFVDAVGAAEPVVVGWSLGGHIALEAVGAVNGLAGVVIYGTPPLASPPVMEEGFLPNPAMGIGFSPEVTRGDAETYAQSFLAPGSALPLDGFVDDILRTDGRARAGLAASVGELRFRDEAEIVATMSEPLAILHGAREQLVNGDFLATVTAPTLWRGAVQTIASAGHAPHREAPDEFDALLAAFAEDVG